MTDDGSPTAELWCPSCFATVGDATVCPSCGMADQHGADAARLRIVVARIHDIASERAELQHELDTLVRERHELFLRVRPATDDGPASAPAVARPEWRPERVRDVLLWLGALLLVIAAITFAAVAWTRLGPAGRAGILLGVTVASAALTRFVRPRLRPTAEALAAITVALALVDWGVAGGTALRGDLSRAGWWAIGLALVALLCATVADRIDLTALRLGATVLAPVAAVFALVAWAPEPAAVVLTLAAITTAVVLVRAALRGRWTDVAPWLGALAVIGEVTVAAGAVVVAIDDWASPGRVAATLAILAVAIAPLVALRTARDAVDPVLVAAITTLALLGAGVTLLSGTVATHWLLAALAVGAVVLAAIGTLLPTRARTGVIGASCLAALAPAAATAPNVAAAWIAPVGWLAHPWTLSLDVHVTGHLGRTTSVAVHDVGPTFVVFAAIAALAFLATAGWRRLERWLGPGALAAIGLAIGVAAVDPTIAGALAIHLAVMTALTVAAILADRRAPGSPVPLALLTFAALAVVPAVGWVAVTPRASLTGLAAVVALGGVGAIAFRSAGLRTGSAVLAGGAFLGGAGVVLSQRHLSTANASFIVVVLGMTMLVAARLVPWRTSARPVAVALETIGAVGAAVGLAGTGTAPTWRVLAYAVVTVGLVLAVRRSDDRSAGYAVAALIAGGITGVAGVATGRLPGEAITIPAAFVALGIALLPRFPVHRSWLRFGPALLMGFVTSVVLAVDTGDGWRVALVLVAASAAVAIGARARLGAPIVVGGCALLVLAIDGAAPYAAAVPRWLLIGTAGAFALWAGATADRRLAQLRRWRSSIDRLT